MTLQDTRSGGAPGTPATEDIQYTLGGLPLKSTYGPEDVAGTNMAEAVGKPGQYPYTRGIYGRMYRETPWMMQQVLGYGLAEHTRERMDLLVKEGMEGYFGQLVFNVVFDNPTKGGLDPDHPEARGHVGLGGMNFSSLADIETLVKDMPLDKVNFSLITGDTCLIGMACYVAAAKKAGYPEAKLRGNSMNWLLKGFCVDNPGFPPRNALFLSTELIKYATEHLPRWNTTNFSGYLIREAGANAAQELAFTLAWADATMQSCVDAGLDPDKFVSRLGFQICVDIDIFEDIAKLRALRRMWAKLTKEKYGCQDPRCHHARIHVHTAGHSLTVQQPLNNMIRATIEALGAVLAGTNSLHTCAYDESIAIPTELSARLALRTQQIILQETNITKVADPLGGSWYIEALTDQIEAEAEKILEEVKARGGFIKALESGWVKATILEEGYRYQEQIRKNERVVVGVNKYKVEEDVHTDRFQMDPAIEQLAVERIKQLRAERDNAAVQAALARVRVAAESRVQGALAPVLIDAVQTYATQQEIMGVLKDVYGWGFGI